jgi:hypothetical protein
MDFERFQRLLQRMELSGIASLSQLVGCSEQEITALEEKYSLRLPETYSLYLRVMGHKSGRLFACDHMSVFYHNVLAMTAEERERWADCRDKDGTGSSPKFELPHNALLIASRLGEQFEFINCSGQDDSPVWHFNTWEWQIRESNPSVLDWLESWCGEAERAIASGYFDLFPDGTTP